MMDRPKLKPNQFAVGHAEYSTGHVLKTDKTLYVQRGDVYLIFESKDDALSYIMKTVKENPDIECWIEDSLGTHLITIDKNGERK
jgi:ethanolamine ammonia-lyase small subunit